MSKRKARNKPKVSTEGKYKALNAFLMLVIVFFVLYSIAKLPRRQKPVASKESRPSVIMPKSAEPLIVAPVIKTKPTEVGTKTEVVPTKPAVIPPKPTTTVSVTPKTKVTIPVSKPKPSAVATKTVKPTVKPAPVKPKEAQKPVTLALKVPPKPAATPIKTSSQGQKMIAIVIDDWGYNLNSAQVLDAKNYSITAAILPNLDNTREVADILHERGFEIILHLPMEPKEGAGLEKDTLLVSLKESQIKDIITKDLSSIPYAKGVNNHMGSLATSDTRTMSTVLKTLRRKNLYFLDSYVIGDSVCADLAKEYRVPFVRRDVFLDNDSQPDYIRAQLARLKSLADEKGWAIGIGHDRRNTLEVLKEEMPKLEKEGYKFVYVSELVK
jgi:polysaccharide deacetylase 2 family uncharacterized protein YibQ